MIQAIPFFEKCAAERTLAGEDLKD